MSSDSFLNSDKRRRVECPDNQSKLLVNTTSNEHCLRSNVFNNRWAPSSREPQNFCYTKYHKCHLQKERFSILVLNPKFRTASERGRLLKVSKCEIENCVVHNYTTHNSHFIWSESFRLLFRFSLFCLQLSRFACQIIPEIGRRTY